MRITNKIMNNNSLYNININKENEDKLSTMTSTGKKITRPSDDPVIAIRSLSLRSNVTMLTQYYSKNASDAESWLDVTEDSLSTVSEVLTDLRKQAVKGSNDYLTLDDLSTIITQMDKLSDEYYSTGNVDYAGRYVFTGYRTGTALTYSSTTTAAYTGINDEFIVTDVDTSSRIIGLNSLVADTTTTSTKAESDINEAEIGRIRLSYSNLSSTAAGDVSLNYRTSMTVGASTSVATTDNKTLAITYKDSTGAIFNVNVPTTGETVTSSGVSYTASYDSTNNKYTVTIGGDSTNTLEFNSDGVCTSLGDKLSASANISDLTTSTISFTSNGTTETIQIPITGNTDKPYTVAVSNGSPPATGYTVTVHTDGTYTIRNTTSLASSTGDNVVNLTANGSVDSSYVEKAATCAGVITSSMTDSEIDAIYKDLADSSSTNANSYYLNAATGEILLGTGLTDTLSSLSNFTNANSIDVVYNKSSWEEGDIRPENLFTCTSNGVVYNGGSTSQTMKYDVGYNQTVEVNTTADEVFTTDVSRDIEDLQNIYDDMVSLSDKISTIKSKLEDTTLSDDDKATLTSKLAAANKAYSYLQDSMMNEFGKKITSIQDSLDKANIAVTENGTRSKRLDLVKTRLQNQLTTFKTLQSDNEDADLAETATNLSSAQLTYQASLMATGKIMQTSLMDYI